MLDHESAVGPEMPFVVHVSDEEVRGPSARLQEACLAGGAVGRRVALQHHAGIEHGGDLLVGSAYGAPLDGAGRHLDPDLPVGHP
jgi:hypothetical protein